METTTKTQFSKDIPKKQLTVSREFNAPVKNVWRAYTESEILDQWWGPAPWRTETKSMDFKVGGTWLYSMVGPDNSRHYSKAIYKEINEFKNFKGEDGFCDENGNFNNNLPITQWNTVFIETPTGTKVEMHLQFSKEEDLNTIVEMGFQEGISIGLDQLETLINEGKV